MPVYNKLVRDLIPHIIENEGKACRTRILGQDEFRMALEEKFLEEWNEYRRASDGNEALEELADVLEVMYGLLAVHGYSPDDLEQRRQAKAAKRGGFDHRIFLIGAED